MPNVRVGMTWDAPAGVVDEANARLAPLAPKSDTLNWLLCYWEPGERWAPVERLVVAEMTPAASVFGQRGFYRGVGHLGLTIADELEGPNPRTLGHFDEVLGRYVYDDLPPNITQRQWLLWREHRALATPVWVVQGTRGGHKRHLAPQEKAVLRMHGRSGDLAAPGDLPYAPLDTRTVKALGEADRLRRWAATMGKGWGERGLRDVWAARAESEAGFTAQMADWLDAQLEDASKDIAKRVNLSDLPRASAEDLAELGGAARHRERFVNDTSTDRNYGLTTEGVLDALDTDAGRIQVAVA